MMLASILASLRWQATRGRAAEREQFRSLSAAKVQKIIQKSAFGEDINTISVKNTVQFV